MQRLTLRRKLSYNTKSNRRTKTRTPGGKLVYIYQKKQGTVPKCGDCKEDLHGIKAMRPAERTRVSRRQKTVSRAYGGSRCHKCVKKRIIRAFLVEEDKLIAKLKKNN